MKDEKILSFVDRLASDEPTLGGGAAAGLAGSLGTAAIMMAIRFSNTDKLSAAEQERLTNAINTLENSKAKFIELIEADEEGFKPLSSAYKLPKNTDEEKSTRKDAIQKGLVTATQAPLAVVEEVEKVVNIAFEVLPLIKKFIVSDVGVGVQLVNSALKSSSLNVYINANLMSDSAQQQKYYDKTDQTVENTSQKVEEIFNQVKDIINS